MNFEVRQRRPQARREQLRVHVPGRVAEAHVAVLPDLPAGRVGGAVVQLCRQRLAEAAVVHADGSRTRSSRISANGASRASARATCRSSSRPADLLARAGCPADHDRSVFAGVLALRAACAEHLLRRRQRLVGQIAEAGNGRARGHAEQQPRCHRRVLEEFLVAYELPGFEDRLMSSSRPKAPPCTALSTAMAETGLLIRPPGRACRRRRGGRTRGPPCLTPANTNS